MLVGSKTTIRCGTSTGSRFFSTSFWVVFFSTRTWRGIPLGFVVLWMLLHPVIWHKWRGWPSLGLDPSPNASSSIHWKCLECLGDLWMKLDETWWNSMGTSSSSSIFRCLKGRPPVPVGAERFRWPATPRRTLWSLRKRRARATRREMV